ncbi:unnamed protein product [Anisakis simplex]|uniref:LETM1 domain-containing protein n=1 Tax=Anisakis simplex TaxID=6269 RepID=A0A0M3J8F2_ANISI|nr:unnamed protein product [Anisakis simplex]
MGLPMVQVFMIAARQISRPIADRVIRYGKTHGVFRNRLLIPLGRGLAHLTTRLRMKHLGLGRPATLAPVSEEAALEQVAFSDFHRHLDFFFDFVVLKLVPKIFSLTISSVFIL